MKQAIKRKNFNLDEIKLKKAQRILRAKTETETIDQALNLVVFRKEILDSLKRTKGKGGVETVF